MNPLDNQLKAAPSKEAAVKFLTKQPNATQELVESFLKRTALIGAGILVLGNSKGIVKNSVAASIAIEAYLLWYYNNQLKALKKSGSTNS